MNEFWELPRAKRKHWHTWDESTFPSYCFEMLVFGKKTLNCGPFTVSPGWSQSSRTGLEVQEGSWRHPMLRVPPVHSSKHNRSCCCMLRKNNCRICSHIKRQDHTYVWTAKRSTKKHSVCHRRQGQEFLLLVFTVMLWPPAWWTVKAHSPRLEISLKRICILVCLLLLFIPPGYFRYT